MLHHRRHRLHYCCSLHRIGESRITHIGRPADRCVTDIYASLDLALDTFRAKFPATVETLLIAQGAYKFVETRFNR